MDALTAGTAVVAMMTLWRTEPRAGTLISMPSAPRASTSAAEESSTMRPGSSAGSWRSRSSTIRLKWRRRLWLPKARACGASSRNEGEAQAGRGSAACPPASAPAGSGGSGGGVVRGGAAVRGAAGRGGGRPRLRSGGAWRRGDARSTRVDAQRAGHRAVRWRLRSRAPRARAVPGARGAARRRRRAPLQAGSCRRSW